LITISLCMIVKNDEAVIERCLNSVSDLVDEIILVDLNSSDRTLNLATKFTNHIHSFDSTQINEESINYLFSLATKDFLFWLKPSEVILDENRLKFLQLKQTINSNTMKNLSLNFNLNSLTDQLLTRILCRENTISMNRENFNELSLTDPVLISDIEITILPYTNDNKINLIVYEKMINHDVQFSPRDLFYYAKALSDDNHYDKAIEYFLKFLRTNQTFEEHNILACNYIANCYHHLNLNELEQTWLLKALQYGKSHPETCCRLGYLFLEKNNYNSAIYWYKEAILNKNNERLKSCNPSCSTWLPHLQLAVCYDKVGKYELAYNHNEIALKYFPTHPSILSNRTYFTNLLNK